MTTLNQAVKTFNQRQATQAALRNEQLTRERVEKLDRRLDALVDWATQETMWVQILRRGFWGRLRWLMRGK